jgi:prepilin signal peptidase PulO-like enzyme (type II secretory pathway)
MTLWLYYAFFAAILLAGLTLLAWTDIKTYRLPNVITYPLMTLGLGSAFVLPQISPRNALIGLCIGYLGLVLIEMVFKRVYNKNGLGRGDAKLLAVGGAWCGAFGLPFIILIASLCGLVFSQMPSQKKRLENAGGQIPFGPFLALGITVIWIGQIWFWVR